MTSAAAAASAATTAMLGGGGTGNGAMTPPGRDTTAPTPAGLKDSRPASIVPATSVSDGSVGRRSVTQSPASSTTATTAASPSLPLAGMMMMMPGDAERIRMRSNASNRRRVKDFNDSITCTLCNGYLIEATTINDCLHAFCRSCIVQYLAQSHKYCPRCKSYNSKPITVTSLRPDRTLRALVYKLVPGLHKSEIQRMVQFYTERQPAPGSLAGTVDDDHLQALLDDQNFYSPDEPISLSLEYHYDTLTDCGVVAEAETDKKVPVTYLQCPAAVTVHHLYKFILTKNGLLVGSDNIRVEIIYEDEILPHDFTLMDVAYCFDYKRVLPMRLFYRILIHPTTKPAQSAIGSQQQWVEEQDKNSSRSGAAGSGSGTTAATAAAATAANTSSTANATTRTNGQRGGNSPKETGGHSGPGKAGTTATAAAVAVAATAAAATSASTLDRPREEIANNSSPVGGGGGNKENTVSNGVNGHHKVATGSASAADSTTSSVVTGTNRTGTSSNQRKPTSPVTSGRKLSSEVEKKTAIKSNAVVAVNGTGSLKMVLVSKPKSPVDEKNGVPPLKVLQQPTTSEAATKLPTTTYSKAAPQQTTGAASSSVSKPVDVSTVKAPKAKSPDVAQTKGTDGQQPSQLKCYVNLKKQTVVGAVNAIPPASPSQAKEIPRLKIELPRLKSSKVGSSPSSSSSSSAATSPSSSAASSSTGKSPVWPMAKEEYAKTIGLKPVYAAVPAPIEEETTKRRKERDEPEEGIDGLASSSHRKRKKGKHSKEAGKRRKLHAEISSQQDASLKMKVKLTEKPPKHERQRSTGNEEDSPPAINTASSSNSTVPPQVSAAPSKPKTPPTLPPMVSVPVPPVVPEVAKVIDITKDDDDVKFVHEQQPPKPGGIAAAVSAKDKLSEMRAIRHKPMVYIPNLDRSLSADSASGTAFNSLIESVQAKVGNRPLVTAAPAPPVTTAPTTTQQQVSSTTATPSSIASVPMVPKPTPALIAAAAGLPPAGSGGPSSLVGKSQPRTPILSPRTMQSYPPLAYPLTNTTTATSAPPAMTGVSSAGIRSMATPIKRSISNDSSNGSTGLPQPKLARMEPPSLVSPLVGPTAKKSTPIQAPMFNFAKGANRAKAAQQAAGLMIQQQQQQQQQQQLAVEPLPYRSPISSSYTKELGSKKPIPNLLIPPSSISVTKMSDLGASSVGSHAAAAMVDCRPPVEILRIPHTAPVADKPTLSPFTTAPATPKPSSGTTPKTTRPPPATIPLIKIKKPATSAGESVTTGGPLGAPPGMTPLKAGMLHKLAAVRPQSESSKSGSTSGGTGSNNVLDLSGMRQPTFSDEVIILDHSPVKAGSSVVDPGTKAARPDGNRNRKFTSDMMGFPVPVSTTTTTTSTISGKTLAPLPKLTEINRNRNLAVRQPNASIRSIPNPSALAFRGAQSATMTSGGGPGSAAGGSSSMAVSTTSSAPNRPTNGNGTSAGAATATVTAAHAHSNGSTLNGHSKSANGVGGAGAAGAATGTGTGSPGSIATTRSPSLNGSHNNNNIKHANANTSPGSHQQQATSNGNNGTAAGASMKKTIETVAAVLKAAAATADTGSTGGSIAGPARSPTVPTTTTAHNGSTGGSNVATTASEMRKPLSGNTVTSTTAAATVTTNGGSVVRTTSVTSVTSGSVTSSVSSTNTPNTASIINVG
ncbi:mucin-19 [Anopheles darlingi]|uniref:mucin-19 n=1 Tax=Anopheles darlingi TaxID=43151 RepID=UPI0021004BA4|nr:mucin-19 [Anopheles darlingi]